MIDVRRRLLLKASLFGMGAIGTPLAAQGWLRGFTHGVASGDPRQTSVILWTRYAGHGDATPLKVEVAEDAGFGRVAVTAEALASAERDHCAKTEVTGLAPGRWYFYRFIAPDGSRSPVGRTRTLPEGRTDAFRIAAFSCANYGFGWFNAYAHAATRADIDLVVHLGDYLYEYPRGDYPATGQTVTGREVFPANELVTLADYRSRYAFYRRDTDLQRLHQLFPSISIWDDHETANDAWMDGAQNHTPATEGDWQVRKAAAKRAYSDWMPMREVAYDSADIGDLATLIRLDTRIEGRDRQLSYGAVLKGASDPQAALSAFRDGPFADPKRSMLGAAQEAWLDTELASSVRRGQRWQLVAQQVLVGDLISGRDATPDWLGADAPDYSRARFTAGLASAQAGLPFNLDSWGGYAPARARFLGSAQAVDANLVVLAGDSHNAWAFELANAGKPAGVEFGVHGTTSPGFEGSLRGIAPDRLAQSLLARNAELKWCETSRRGYMTVSLTREAVRCDWHLLATVRERRIEIQNVSATSARGSKRLAFS